MASNESGEYGGFWIRFLAYLADSAILFVVIVILAAVFGMLGMVMIANIVIFLLQVLYWPVMQASARQATFGKSMLGLKVTDLEGDRISFLRSLGRELAKILSAIPMMIGFVIAAFTGKKQALHDLIASTTVVRAGEASIGKAIAVTAVGFVAPVVLVMVLGVGLFAAFLGEGMEDMQAQVRAEMEKQAAAQVKTTPQPPAPPPAPPAPAAQAAAPQPVPQAVPQPVPQVAPQPAAAAAIPAPQAKPAAEPPPAAPKPEPIAAASSAPRAAPRPEPEPEPERRRSGLDALEEAPPLPSAARSAPAAPAPRHNDLMSAVLARDPASVDQLLKMGRWPDKTDSSGMTPLMMAAQFGDARSAELLLKAGANPNLTVGGKSASTIALERGHFPVLDVLRKYGAR